MKTLLTLLIMLPLCSLAQEETAELVRTAKTTTVADTRWVKISKIIFYDDPDTVYTMHARDARYTYNVEFLAVANGSLNHMKKLLTICLDSFKEEPGTSMAFGNNRITVEKMVGMRSVFLYDDDSDGFTELTKGTITRLLSQLE